VSGPAGDRIDWSSFTVEDGDPMEFDGVLFCEEFAGTGSITLTIYEVSAPVATASCSESSPEEFIGTELVVGATYFVSAEFIGEGFAVWFLESDDE